MFLVLDLGLSSAAGEGAPDPSVEPGAEAEAALDLDFFFCFLTETTVSVGASLATSAASARALPLLDDALVEALKSDVGIFRSPAGTNATVSGSATWLDAAASTVGISTGAVWKEEWMED